MARRGASRGFTLVELLAVLVIVGVLIVAASPTFVRLARDRRVSRAGFYLVDYLRTARTLAIGHGQPIVLRWQAAGFISGAPDSTAGTGGVQIVEPIVTTNNAAMSCTTTAWTSPTATQVVSTFDIQNNEYNYTAITFYDDGGNGNPGSGTVQIFAEFCFSPTGRMYLRTAVGGPFHLVLGVPTFAVFNLQNNPSQTINATTRWVLAPPSGAARMQL